MEKSNSRLEGKVEEYKQPKVEVLNFSYEDIVRTSECINVGCIGRLIAQFEDDTRI